MNFEQQSLQHLEGESVLATAVLESWKLEADQYVILVKSVDILDYATAKPIAPQLDHAWISLKADYWKNLEGLNWTTQGRFIRHEPVNFVARVRRDTRSDGTGDYGLRLINHYPVTLAQQADMRKANQKHAKLFYRLPGRVLIPSLAAIRLALRRMELRIEDWRDYSDRSFKDARSTALNRISKLEGILRPLMSAETLEKAVELELRRTEEQIQEHLNL